MPVQVAWSHPGSDSVGWQLETVWQLDSTRLNHDGHGPGGPGRAGPAPHCRRAGPAPGPHYRRTVPGQPGRVDSRARCMIRRTQSR